MRKIIAALALVLFVGGCSNSSVQTSENGVLVAEMSGSVLIYSMDQIIAKTLVDADKHCQKAREQQIEVSNGNYGFRIFTLLDQSREELETFKELLETGKGIFDLFPSHSYRVTGRCDTPPMASKSD